MPDANPSVIPPSSRAELCLLVSQASEALERGVDVVDVNALLDLQKGYYRQSLDRLCEGIGDEQDVIDLVGWHWPDLLESQPRMPIDWWQARLIRDILAGRKTDLKEVFIKGCTKSGKGFSVAMAACLWYQSREDSCRIVVTSNSSEHARKVMMAEIIRLRKSMMYSCEGSNSREAVWTSETKYIKTANPQHGESFCHDDKTEVLTRRGWLKWCDVTLDDELLTKDPVTNVAEYGRPTSLVSDEYDGPMYEYQSRNVDFCVTPNHEMWIQRPTRTGAAYERVAVRDVTVKRAWMDRCVENRNPGLKRLVVSEFGIVDIQAWLEFLGWWITDGSVRHGCVSVTQIKAHGKSRITELLSRLPFRFKEISRDGKLVEWLIYSAHLSDYLIETCGRLKMDRKAPDYLRDCSVPQLRAFLDGVIGGDGTPHGENRTAIGGASYKLLSSLHEVAVLAGYSASLKPRSMMSKSLAMIGDRVIPSNLQQYILGINRNQRRIKWRPSRGQIVHYSGKVYCATVPPHHLLLTRRNGQTLWSGNSGQHSEATLFVFDESTGIVEEFFDLAATQAAMIVCISNPRNSHGWFRRAYPADDDAADLNQVIDIPGGRRALHTVGGKDCINVKTGETIIPAQIDRPRYEAIKAKGDRWGRVFGDGRFPEAGEDDVIIAGPWLERHRAAWGEHIQVVTFGLDVASSVAGDESVLACGGPGGCRKLHAIQIKDTMQVISWAMRLALNHYGVDLRKGENPVAVDMDGLGAGVGHRMMELGVLVLEYRGNATSGVDPKKYRNLRAEGYGELGERLKPTGPYQDEPYGLPHDEMLMEELVAPKKVYSSDGFSYHITPKTHPDPSYAGDTLTKLLGRSPDRGDAVAMLYYSTRYYVQLTQWSQSWQGDILASGDGDPLGHVPLKDEELEGTAEWLRDIVESARDRTGIDDDTFGNSGESNWSPFS